MLQIRKANDRGLGYHGWLKTRHTFSFADYYDPKHMNFRSLRVINEDHIDGGSGFGAHPHRDMEIITYVVSGALEHQDSMGNNTAILPGEVQRMSAGSGVTHSEYNKLADQATHLFQIWLIPNRPGGNPGYGQKSFENELNNQNIVLVVSADGRDGSITIQQDADIYISRLRTDDKVAFEMRPGRGVWIQMVKGFVTVNGQDLKSGDGLGIEEEKLLQIQATEDSEFILFDLA
ncbi:MAG: quercetin 2,3-dioxygenase [Bdellovibrio sp. CG10_big_fil_rev_8_21_14_0_10_47_8]|nr:MAG: quercetin 2,3-dioxygenase [Bdellovibrio sp. CG10_big_fil_rev_8_21_14_0_10_47_8]